MSSLESVYLALYRLQVVEERLTVSTVMQWKRQTAGTYQHA